MRYNGGSNGKVRLVYWNEKPLKEDIMIKKDYDKLLHIFTSEEQKGFLKSYHYHRYEPTPYEALDELFEHCQLKSEDRVVDYGCGKGRLNFYLHYRFGASVTGIEMNEDFYREAQENRERYLRKHRIGDGAIKFLFCLAEEYEVHPSDNRFYFFNPFTVQIFMKIADYILTSVEQHYRDIELIFYYPSEDYVYFLENHPLFEWKREVRLKGYEQNVNERFLIYGLAY
jgi:SAM-dependent methyltransferase